MYEIFGAIVIFGFAAMVIISMLAVAIEDFNEFLDTHR